MVCLGVFLCVLRTSSFNGLHCALQPFLYVVICIFLTMIHSGVYRWHGLAIRRYNTAIYGCIIASNCFIALYNICCI